ncbi:MAG: ATP-binding cassette domain-containing protein [Desulfobacterales bacterium]|jgi:oligopeptide/dipeptide ABC transporter ATP-binding protein
MLTEKNWLLQVRNMKRYFPVRKGIFKNVVGHIKAVDDVSLYIKEGETLGLVGESGCGKTTLGRSILRLGGRPTAGDVLFRSMRLADPGQAYKEINITSAPRNLLKFLRQDIQIIFQDPYSSLDPRMQVASIIGEPLYVHGIVKRAEVEDRVGLLLDSVGLNAGHMRRYPHQFSGGQRQRIGIARAIALEPQLIIADEPVSSLDVSIRAQVVNLLQDLQERLGLTYLFIAHDLSLIKYISDRITVMYLGKVVEMAEAKELFLNPKHPYTEALMSAVPVPDPRYKIKQILLSGDVPSPLNPPAGCNFHPRCPYSKDNCKKDLPRYRDIGGEHFVACHYADSLNLNGIRIL